MDPYADLCMACEKKATLRCPPCTKAGQDTKFCSKECQKIMWKSHKVYCGKGKQVFFEPALLREEFDTFLQVTRRGSDEPIDVPVNFTHQIDNLIRLCQKGSQASPPNSGEAWEFWKINENVSNQWELERCTNFFRTITYSRWNQLTQEVKESIYLPPFTFIYCILPFFQHVDELEAEEWIKINSDFLYSYLNLTTYTLSIRNKPMDNSDRKTSINLWDRVCQEFEKVKQVSDPEQVTLEFMESFDRRFDYYRKRLLDDLS